MVHSGYHPLKHCPLRIDAWMVHSGYHPLKHRPLRISAWMEKSGYHPLKHCPLRIVLGWCTVDIILLSIVLLG